MSRQPSQTTIASRQERAASRIVDDERLRGDLADDEFQPLLDWALAATDRIAAATAGLDDPSADQKIEDGVAAVKEIVRLVGEIATADGAERRSALFAELGRLVGSPIVDRARVGAVRKRLKKLAEQRARDTSQIVAALSPKAMP